MNTFQILLASNSNAAEHMAEAMERLVTIFPSDIRFSEVLESRAVNKAGESLIDGGVYLNAVCRACTEKPLDRVQQLMKEMETEMGRIRGSAANGLVAINDFTGEVLSGQGHLPEGYNGWILKLDGVVPGSAEKLSEEYAFYKKAQVCGIQVAESRILRDGHWKHLLVKRFDRTDKDKVVFVTCPSNFNSWEEVFRLMRTWRLPYPDMNELFKRLVFSLFTNNKDYRTSKICFTYSLNEQWRLAPAFNLKPSAEKPEFALSLLGKTNDWTDEELRVFGKQLNIRKASKIIDELRAILL
jgi:serine/threonine-protein kinase HipA